MRGACYYPVRMAYHSYSQVNRAVRLTTVQASIPREGDFTLLRSRSPGFRSCGSDLSTCVLSPSILRYAVIWSPCGFSLEGINLATATESLARDSRRTARPRSGPLACTVSYVRFTDRLFFQAVPNRNHLVSSAFKPPSGVLFNFPSQY